MEEKKFKVPVLIKSMEAGQGKWSMLEVILGFETPEEAVAAAIAFLEGIEKDPGITQPMVACVDRTPLVYGNFRMKLIQILEEKFGLKVKVCGNCKDFDFADLCIRDKKAYGKPDRFQDWCDHEGGWAPKEKAAPEK